MLSLCLEKHEGEVLLGSDVDYLGDPYSTRSNPKKQEEPLSKSLPGNHVQFQQFAKNLKMFIEVQNIVKGTFQEKNNFSQLTIRNKTMR